MTTKVTIDAHAGWPVQVILTNPKDGFEREERVEAYEKRDFVLTDTQMITAKELTDEFVQRQGN